jgi:hypothetical protein
MDFQRDMMFDFENFKQRNGFLLIVYQEMDLEIQKLLKKEEK